MTLQLWVTNLEFEAIVIVVSTESSAQSRRRLSHIHVFRWGTLGFYLSAADSFPPGVYMFFKLPESGGEFIMFTDGMLVGGVFIYWFQSMCVEWGVFGAMNGWISKTDLKNETTKQKNIAVKNILISYSGKWFKNVPHIECVCVTHMCEFVTSDLYKAHSVSQEECGMQMKEII